MNILLVHEDRREPGQGGGAESLLRDEAAGLKALGHSVSWWDAQSGTIAEAVERSKADIVHLSTIHNFAPNWQEIPRWLQESRVPHLWALMDYWPFCRNRMLLKDLYAPPVSCAAVEGVCDGQCVEGRAEPDRLGLVNGSPVVALNRYTAELYRRNGLRVDYVVELGVDTTLFAPDPAQRTERVSVWTHSAWPEWGTKGMHVLRAAVAGTGVEVNLMAHMSRADVARGLKRAHIHVFPSCYQETWGLCLNEAMASGCACIASDVCGPRAQMHDGIGLLVPPGDADALRAAIERLLDDEALRRSLGENARAHVVAEHSLEAMARRWEAAYREVLRG